MDILEKHVTNIMDCYCKYYDNEREKETTGKMIPSIFDNSRIEELEGHIKKVMECVCSYMKLNVDDIPKEKYQRVKANLYIRHQVRLMGIKMSKDGLLRYLDIFYKGCYNLDLGSTLDEKHARDFRSIFLDALMEVEFREHLQGHMRFLNLYERVLDKTITEAETAEMDSIEKHMGNCRHNLDHDYAFIFELFNRNYGLKDENNREEFNSFYNREIMNLIDPLVNTREYVSSIIDYVTVDGDIDYDRLEDVMTNTGLFYGRLALLGSDNKDANINLPLSIDKLDGDSLDLMTMFDTYFKLYEEGYSRFNNLVKKMD